MKHVSKMNKALSVAGILLVALLYSHAVTAIGFNSTYEASSGVFPDEVCPPWTLVNTASPEDPSLSGGKLIISTSTNVENMFYIQSAPDIAAPDPLIIEARVRFVSGSASTPVRAPILIGFTTSPSEGNALFIGAGEIFLLVDDLVKGASANVDTNDDFHTYRIEVSGTGSVEVFYDGVSTLIGSTFTSATANGNVERVFWGEASSLALGTSEWEFVRHNASTVECTLGVQIDIKPGSDPNSINPRSRGVIPVAILTTETFDASTVDPNTVEFGPNGAAPVHAALEDVDGDADLDLILHFKTQETGIACGDTSASLTGETTGGQTIEGSDAVNMVGCS